MTEHAGVIRDEEEQRADLTELNLLAKCMENVGVQPDIAGYQRPRLRCAVNGALTRRLASDGGYEKGSFLKEPSDADHVHIGENRGATDIVLDVLYVLPHGAPFSQDAPSPGCELP